MVDKQEEGRYLQHLLVSLGMGDYRIVHSESPDFLIMSGSRVIGVEVTKYLPKKRGNEPLPQEQTSLRRKLLKRAESIWFAEENSPVNVLAVFEPGALFTKASAKDASDSIVKYMLDRGMSSLPIEGRFHVLDAAEAIHQLRKLVVNRIPSKAYACWQESLGGWTREATKDEIQELVGSKSSKMGLYLSHAPEIWLVGILQNIEAGELVQIPRGPVAYAVETKFKRVFLVNGLAFHYIEIPVSRDA